jgi:uncharacterized Zn-finger protein
MMLKFHNELAAPEIRIGVNEFNCIGVLPPHDHPHIYLTVETTSMCQHSTDVIRQRQQRAHRNVRLTTRSGRRQIIGCRYQSRRRPGYSTFPAIR